MFDEQAGGTTRCLTAKALCVTNDALAAETGADMMRRGGNAFDAAVAAGFMATVVAPHHCGIGGYAATGIGFVAKTRQLVALDANAVAPQAAHAEMFPVVPGDEPNAYTRPDDAHKRGALSVAVPGVLGGLLTMLEKWGRLDRRTVMAPAIRQAREGVAVSPGRMLSWLRMKAEAEARPAPNRDQLPDKLAMPELADVLEQIAAEGLDAFYTGKIGAAIADHVRKLGGILTRSDMAAYRPRVVEPLTIELGAHTVATPPPGAGGLTSLQMAALFDRLQRDGKAGAAGTAAAYEAMIEIQKVAWEDRLTTLADPSAMAAPAQSLLTEAHLQTLLGRVQAGLARPALGRLIAPDPLRGTVHLTAADEEGNLVAWTQTHGGAFGSGIMVPWTEIVLGHGMCRFEPRPGWPNSIAPGKRPLHNMCPVIALKHGLPVLATGASGGRTIVNNCASLLIGRLVYGLDVATAAASPRVQCETLEPASIEAAAGADCLAALRQRGHLLKETNGDSGTIHVIARSESAWLGVPEPRMLPAVARGI